MDLKTVSKYPKWFLGPIYLLMSHKNNFKWLKGSVIYTNKSIAFFLLQENLYLALDMAFRKATG